MEIDDKTASEKKKEKSFVLNLHLCFQFYICFMPIGFHFLSKFTFKEYRKEVELKHGDEGHGWLTETQTREENTRRRRVRKSLRR